MSETSEIFPSTQQIQKIVQNKSGCQSAQNLVIGSLKLTHPDSWLGKSLLEMILVRLNSIQLNLHILTSDSNDIPTLASKGKARYKFTIILSPD